MTSTIAFVAFIAWALVCLDVFGLTLGALIWLVTFASVQFVCRQGRRLIGDPMDAYDRERQAVNSRPTDSAP